MQTKEDYLKVMNEIIEDIKRLELKAVLAKFALFVSVAFLCLSFVKGDLSVIDFVAPSVFMIIVGSLQSSADYKYTELYNSVMGLWDNNIMLNEDDVDSLLFENEKIQLIVDEKEKERIDEAIGKYGVMGLENELISEPTLKYSHRLRLGALERYLFLHDEIFSGILSQGYLAAFKASLGFFPILAFLSIVFSDASFSNITLLVLSVMLTTSIQGFIVIKKSLSELKKELTHFEIVEQYLNNYMQSTSEK